MSVILGGGGVHRAMTLDSVGRNNLPDVVLGDEREELETEAGPESVRVFDTLSASPVQRHKLTSKPSQVATHILIRFGTFAHPTQNRNTPKP